MWKLLVSSLAASAVAVPLNVVHERRGSARQPWKVSSIDRSAIIPVRIGLAQRNMDKGYAHVMDVSDPDSANYGKHWSAEDVYAEFGPSDESLDLVKAWLKQSGIENARQTSNKGWVSFNAPVHQVEKMLNAQFREYQGNDGTTRLGCDEYSLPQHLTSHIDYITPGVKLSPPVKKSQHKRDSRGGKQNKKFSPPSRTPFHGPYIPPAGVMGLPPDVQNCGVNITPPCYRALYNIPAASNFSIAAGEIGIFEDGDVYAQADLDQYFAAYAPYVPQGTGPNIYHINGAQAPFPQNSSGGESDLDFSIAYSLLGGVNISLYQTQTPVNFTGSFAPTLIDPFLDAIDGSYCSDEEKAAGFQCGAYPLAKVISGSYSTPELFYQSAASQVRACNEIMKLSLQGHTIVFSSGDYGVASNPGFGEALCVDNGCVPQNLNNTGYNAYTGPVFSPGFPANCPYVLTVGGTQLLSNQTVNDPESVMNVPSVGFAGCPADVSFSSGGGFSNYFSRLSYQDDAVQSYFDNYVPDYPYYESNLVDVADSNTTIASNNGIYNRGGRAIPDVSANGAYGLFVNEGEVQQFFGTSLATPLWAAVITMLNSEREASGKSPVGFVQPALYKNPQAFNDITVGGNPGCGTKGFPAVKGWDPSTGLGTPDYAKLSEVFQNLQ